MRLAVAVAVAVLGPTLFAVPPALAQPQFIADAALGPAYLTKARSKTPSHLFKPGLRAAGRAQILPRLELGAAALALAGNQHYRVLGVLAQSRWAVFAGERASMGANLGLGFGHDADILHDDLSAPGALAPYWSVALDTRFALSNRWSCGVELGWHNAALVQLGLVAAHRFGGQP